MIVDDDDDDDEEDNADADADESGSLEIGDLGLLLVLPYWEEVDVEE